MSQVNATFAPRQRVGNYELLVELGSGGTATVGIAVYRGAAGFERLVVVKRVHRRLTKDREFARMLLDEARLASSIRHPNVVPVIDVVQTDDEVVLVMEYVEAVSLAHLLRLAAQAGKKLHPAVVSRIVVDALTGLHEAHEALDLRRQALGIVHRDVTPENILVGVDGTSRVIDFGIAKAASRLARTQAGVVKGKCSYMAPEQVDGQPVDRRCDVFAAGIVLWEALTSQRLFRGDDEFDEMRRVMQAPIPAPSSVVPVSSAVDSLLAMALARTPEGRFPTAKAFARTLEQTIAPAPTSIVADHVASIAGTDIEERRARLAAVLGDELDRLSPRATVPSVPPGAPSGMVPPGAPSGMILPSVPGGTLRMDLPLPRPLPPTQGPPLQALPARTLPSRDALPAPRAVDRSALASPSDANRSALASPSYADRSALAPRSYADRTSPVPARPRRGKSMLPMLAIVLVVSVLAGAGIALAWLSR